MIGKFIIVFAAIGACTIQFGSANSVESQAIQADAIAAPLTAKGPIQCYHCNSFLDAGCEKNTTLKEKYLKPCDEWEGKPAIGCWMQSQEIEYDQSSELVAHYRVIRRCAYHHQDIPCLHRAGFGASIAHCFCNTTACNPANSLVASPLFSFVAIVFATIFAYLMH